MARSVHEVPVKRSRVPVFIGILGTGFFLMLFLVFAGAAAGNSGMANTFEKHFVPISIGVFVAYVVACEVLHWAKMDRTAMALAWAPLVLGFIVIPVLQWIGLFIQWLIQRG